MLQKLTLNVLKVCYYAFWQASRGMSQMHQLSCTGRFLVNFCTMG